MGGIDPSDDAVWRRVPSVLHRSVGDQVVALPEGRDTPVVLAGAAAVLWHALDEPRDLASVRSELAEVGVEDAHGPQSRLWLRQAREALSAEGIIEPVTGRGRKDGR